MTDKPTESTIDNVQELVPANTTSMEPNNIDAISKIKQNLSPGIEPEPLPPPVLTEYFTKVMSPFVIATGLWTTSNPGGLVLFDQPIGPTPGYWRSPRVPYWCHEAFKWAYYRCTFKLRIVFFGSEAYRGSLRLRRTFVPQTGARPRAIEHRHVIDGGNLVHEHDLRMSAVGNYKLAYLNEYPVTTTNAVKPQDIYYEFLQISVQAPLTAPGIYPTTIPYMIFLEPLSDLEFSIRRNNLEPYIGTFTKDNKTQSYTHDNSASWLATE